MDRLIKRFRHYLVPGQSNNFRARALHTSSIFFYIIILLFIQTTRPILHTINPNILGYATNITMERILLLVNQERAKVNLAPLSVSTLLQSAAAAKASDMFNKNYWAHISPTGVTPWTFITGAGYQYLYAGENLAKSFSSSDEVVAAWMKSPTHRANILKKEYTEIGLAVMNGTLAGEETTLVVQEFGTRVKNKAVLAQNPEELPSVTVIPKVAVIPTGTSQKVAFIDSSGLQVVQNKETTPKIQGSSFTKNTSLLLAEFLLLVLFIDSIYIWKHKTARITGRNLSHIIFLATLIGAMVSAGVGVIL